MVTKHKAEADRRKERQAAVEASLQSTEVKAAVRAAGPGMQRAFEFFARWKGSGESMPLPGFLILGECFGILGKDALTLVFRQVAGQGLTSELFPQALFQCVVRVVDSETGDAGTQDEETAWREGFKALCRHMLLYDKDKKALTSVLDKYKRFREALPEFRYAGGSAQDGEGALREANTDVAEDAGPVAADGPLDGDATVPRPGPSGTPAAAAGGGDVQPSLLAVAAPEPTPVGSPDTDVPSAESPRETAPDAEGLSADDLAAQASAAEDAGGLAGGDGPGEDDGGAGDALQGVAAAPRPGVDPAGVPDDEGADDEGGAVLQSPRADAAGAADEGGVAAVESSGPGAEAAATEAVVAESDAAKDALAGSAEEAVSAEQGSTEDPDGGVAGAAPPGEVPSGERPSGGAAPEGEASPSGAGGKSPGEGGAMAPAD